MSDTIISSDLVRFKTFVSKPRGDNVYEGYDLNADGMVEMSFYDADSHELVDREVFGQNGLAQKYIDQEQEMFERNKASGWWTAPEDEHEHEDDDRKDKEVMSY